jgi:hypothetical protein
LDAVCNSKITVVLPHLIPQHSVRWVVGIVLFALVFLQLFGFLAKVLQNLRPSFLSYLMWCHFSIGFHRFPQN